MIKGIGTDIVDIRRVEKLIARKGWDEFAKKILSKEEIKNLRPKQKNNAAHLAKRFAAKEAVAKALGTGIGKTKFEDITISSNSKGAPKVKIAKLENVKIYISMADEHPYAIAFAVVSVPKNIY